jgi:hypothetical protein
MPRMGASETTAIVRRGLTELNMDADPTVFDFINRAAQGFPQYAHLLGKAFAKAAIARGSYLIGPGDLPAALEDAVSGVEHSVRAEYNAAVFSPTSKAIYKQVILACAMAAMDSENYFTPKDLAASLSFFLHRQVRSDTYNKHLVEFSETRGPVLERTGQSNRWRYRFRDPALPPYIVLLAAMEGLVTFAGPASEERPSRSNSRRPDANEQERLF